MLIDIIKCLLAYFIYVGGGKVKQVDVQFKGKYNLDWYLDYGNDYYTYNEPDNMNLRIGDYVVVETRYGLSLALVLQVREEKEPVETTAKIVTKVEGYNLVDEENKKKRIKEIEAELKNLEDRLKDEERYNLILKVFPEAKSLIDEYKNLINK